MPSDWNFPVFVVGAFIFLTSIVVGSTQHNINEDKLKHETCYTKYGYDAKSEESYIIESYCGEGVNE